MIKIKLLIPTLSFVMHLSSKTRENSSYDRGQVRADVRLHNASHHDRRAKCTFDPPIAFRTTWGVQISRREEKRSGRISPTPKNELVVQILSSRAIYIYIYFPSTNVFTIDGKESCSSLERAMNRNSPLAILSKAKNDRSETAWKIRKMPRTLSQESSTELDAKPLGVICINAYRETWITAPNLLPLSVLTEFA